MHKLLLSTSVGILALFSAGAANAADELLTLQKDPKQWALPTGDYANLRYSSLKQITTENVGRLAPAWSFSTGVLRGHEGAPLVGPEGVVDGVRLHGRPFAVGVSWVADPCPEGTKGGPWFGIPRPYGA